MILMNTWQALLGYDNRSLDSIRLRRTNYEISTLIFGLPNGGPAGLIYMYIIVVVFFSLVNISMAEMASMAPTAGGQVGYITY